VNQIGEEIKTREQLLTSALDPVGLRGGREEKTHGEENDENAAVQYGGRMQLQFERVQLNTVVGKGHRTEEVAGQKIGKGVLLHKKRKN